MQIIRTDFSAYFPSDFEQREKSLFENEGLGSYMKAEDFLEKNLLDQSDELIVISNTQTDFNKWPKQMWDKTKLLIHPNSGYDNFSAQWVESVGFPIVVGHEIRAQAVAEYCLSTFLQRVAQVPQQNKWSKERQFPRDLIQGQNVLIVGLGHIGGRIKNWLESLGARVQVFDPYKGHFQLDLAQSKTVILACGLNPSSQHLIDKAFIQELPKAFTLINAARGGLIKTNDLVQALKNDPESCAYLDVFEKEPADLEELTKTTNLFATSHIAGVYTGLNERMLEFEKQVIKHFLSLDLPSFQRHYNDQLLASRLHKGFLI
jgi:D-3-phosphoglycerate dehydrogenase